MREIIGENMKLVFDKCEITYNSTYQGNIGYWPNFEVYEISDDDYKKLCNMTDEEWKALNLDDSWWRGAEGSNMGIPNEVFEINNKQILAWRNEYRDNNAQNEWNDMSDEDQEDWGSYAEFLEFCCSTYYEDILEYFCEVLGASTEKNVCALATDLAKYNNMTLGELFTVYGGSK